MDPCRGEYLWYKGNSNFQRRKKMRQNGVRSNVRFPTGASGMKKGGIDYKEEVGKVAIDPRSKIITNQDDPMNKINEGNTVDVRGRRRMLADKKKTATWY